MGLPASYLLVTVAFCAVLHYDAQFRQDLFDGIKGMQGRYDFLPRTVARLSVSVLSKLSIYP